MDRGYRPEEYCKEDVRGGVRNVEGGVCKVEVVGGDTQGGRSGGGGGGGGGWH